MLSLGSWPCIQCRHGCLFLVYLPQLSSLLHPLGFAASGSPVGWDLHAWHHVGRGERDSSFCSMTWQPAWWASWGPRPCLGALNLPFPVATAERRHLLCFGTPMGTAVLADHSSGWLLGPRWAQHRVQGRISHPEHRLVQGSRHSGWLMWAEGFAFHACPEWLKSRRIGGEGADGSHSRAGRGRGWVLQGGKVNALKQNQLLSCAGLCEATRLQSSLRLSQVCTHESLCGWSKRRQC